VEIHELYVVCRRAALRADARAIENRIARSQQEHGQRCQYDYTPSPFDHNTTISIFIEKVKKTDP
jgi:hypothetical protein